MTALSGLAPSLLASLVLDASAGPGPALDAANDDDDARASDELAVLEAIVGDAHFQRLGPRRARLALPVIIAVITANVQTNIRHFRIALQPRSALFQNISFCITVDCRTATALQPWRRRRRRRSLWSCTCLRVTRRAPRLWRRCTAAPRRLQQLRMLPLRVQLPLLPPASLLKATCPKLRASGRRWWTPPWRSAGAATSACTTCTSGRATSTCRAYGSRHCCGRRQRRTPRRRPRALASLQWAGPARYPRRPRAFRHPRRLLRTRLQKAHP